MVGSNFSDLDQQMLDNLNKQLATVSASAVKGSASVRDFAKEITHIAEAMNRIENKAILNPKNLEQTYDLVDQIKSKMLELGAPIHGINDALQEESLKLKGQLVDYSRLGILTKIKYGWEKLSKDEIIGYTKKGKEYVPVLESQVSLMSKLRVGATGAAGSIAGWATSLSGVSLSIGGILAKVLEAYDATNRIRAMSSQTNAQWSQGNQSIGEASSLIMNLHKQFKISVDQSGQYVNNLAKAGFEKKELLGMSRDLLANEIMYGQSIESQVNTIKNLSLNFNKTTEYALNYASTIREIAKEMPDLSIDEVLKDVTELADKQKYYNVNLLSTVGLYTTLMNKNLSKSLGLENVPTEFKKNLLSGLAGAGASMPDEWKAIIGAKRGEAPTIKTLLKFEGMTEGERLEAIVMKLPEIMGKVKDKSDPQVYVLRKLVESMGILDKQGSKQFAELMSGEGPLSTNKIGNLLKTAFSQQEAAKKKMASAAETRDSITTKALTAAANLQSTADMLAQKITDFIMTEVIPVLRDIAGSLKRLANKWGTSGGIIESIIPGAATIREGSELKAKAKNLEAEKEAGLYAISVAEHAVVKSLSLEGKPQEELEKTKAYSGFADLAYNLDKFDMSSGKVADRYKREESLLQAQYLEKPLQSTVRQKVFKQAIVEYSPQGMKKKEEISQALKEILEYAKDTGDYATSFKALSQGLTMEQIKRKNVRPVANPVMKEMTGKKKVKQPT